MPNFYGIQNILSRINTIQSKFKPPTASPSLNNNKTPFDANLRRAMGSQNNQFTTCGLNGPDSLKSLLNAMGSNSKNNINIEKTNFGDKLAEIAKSWNGKDFKSGQTARCADFVSTMIEKSEATPKNFKHEVNCWELQKQGKKVSKKNLKRGDIVYFGYTYLPVDYTHVGIYLGDGKFVHRPTKDKPVRIDSIEKGYYAKKYSSARRL